MIVALAHTRRSDRLRADLDKNVMSESKIAAGFCACDLDRNFSRHVRHVGSAAAENRPQLAALRRLISSAETPLFAETANRVGATKK